MDRVRGTGPTIFAAVLLAVGGVLNGIHGIAAPWNSSFFVGGAHQIFGWGWVSLIHGILKLVAAPLDIPERRLRAVPSARWWRSESWLRSPRARSGPSPYLL
jgi:hypothetical protein